MYLKAIVLFYSHFASRPLHKRHNQSLLWSFPSYPLFQNQEELPCYYLASLNILIDVPLIVSHFNFLKAKKPNHAYTVEQFNIRTVAFFSLNFLQFFSIFSKATQNYKMLYISYERPEKLAFNFAKRKGMAAPKRRPCP